MFSLLRRLQRLESQRVDLTGPAPYSEAWFTSWEDKLNRLMAGQDIRNVRIPLGVIDRIIADGDDG